MLVEKCSLIDGWSDDIFVIEVGLGLVREVFLFIFVNYLRVK